MTSDEANACSGRSLGKHSKIRLKPLFIGPMSATPKEESRGKARVLVFIIPVTLWLFGYKTQSLRYGWVKYIEALTDQNARFFIIPDTS